MEQYERYMDNLKIIDVSPNPDYIEKKFSNVSNGTVDSIQRENSCKLQVSESSLIIFIIQRDAIYLIRKR